MTTAEPHFDAAFVLHARPYRETSALVELLCRDRGRTAAVFRQVRGSRSARNGLLQPFQPVWVSLGGTQELKSGRQVESRAVAVWLTGTALYSGLYLNELLMRLLQREDAHPGLFDLYEHTLPMLADGWIEPALRCFERRLLAALGYELQWERCVDGHAISPDGHYRFDAQSGFIRCAAPIEPDVSVFAGHRLQGIAAEAFEETVILRDAKRLFRLALAPHLGDKPLQSRALFSAGRGAGGPSF